MLSVCSVYKKRILSSDNEKTIFPIWYKNIRVSVAPEHSSSRREGSAELLFSEKEVHHGLLSPIAVCASHKLASSSKPAML